ncbi:unnamed protein product [Boreogadus saida]
MNADEGERISDGCRGFRAQQLVAPTEHHKSGPGQPSRKHRSIVGQEIYGSILTPQSLKITRALQEGGGSRCTNALSLSYSQREEREEREEEREKREERRRRGRTLLPPSEGYTALSLTHSQSEGEGGEEEKKEEER